MDQWTSGILKATTAVDSSVEKYVIKFGNRKYIGMQST